jgi:hypothetical protein
MAIPSMCIVAEDYKSDKWPRSFTAVPNQGDLVESRSGEVLQVQYVIHVEDTTNSPHIKVVLTDVVP